MIAKQERVCPKHGEYTAIQYLRNLWSSCPRCVEENESWRKERERREEKKRYETRLSDSGIPPRYKDKTLSNFLTKTSQQKNVLQRVTDYANEILHSSARCLILSGAPGTGKTHICCAIVQHVIDHHLTALYETADRLLRARQEGGHRRYIDAHVLAIDEVGTRQTDFESKALFEIIDERYANLTPTIIASNLTLDELTEFLGVRAMDRFAEDDGLLIPMQWPSWRSRMFSQE